MTKGNLLILLFGVFGAGISVQTAFAYTPHELPPPSLKVPTYYATDRLQMTSNKNSDGATLARLTLGEGTVIIPMESRWSVNGGVTAPLDNIGCTVDPNRSTMMPYIEPRGYVAEPDESKVLENVHEADIWPKLLAAAIKCGKIYIYIHGFASSGNNALYSAGILSPNVEAPVIAFTWPSKGTAGLKKIRVVGKASTRELYNADKKMIDNPQVMLDLTELLTEIRTKLPAPVEVNIIAHSMGNRLLSKYLVSDAMEVFDNIYFLSADVEADFFKMVAEKLKVKARNSVVYFNPHDRALKASSINHALNLKFAKILGDARLPVSGIEFVNYDKIAQPDTYEFAKLKHYVPFYYLGNMIRLGAPTCSENEGEYFCYRNTKIEKRKKK